MTQGDRRAYLIQTLCREMPQYGTIRILGTQAGQEQLIRALMNVRPPVPASEEFLKVQDAYLKEEIEKRGVTDSALLVPSGIDRRVFLWKGDITRLKADAVVNAANSALLGCFRPLHACIDNAIHSFSGVQLRLECSRLMQAQGHGEPAGGAKITPAYNLPCRYILHTVGPVISGPLRQEDIRLLADCYGSCLRLAVRHGLKSIAFCCISTGVFCFPQHKAAETAVESVLHFLEQDDTVEQVIFDVYTDRDYMIYKQLLES